LWRDFGTVRMSSTQGDPVLLQQAMNSSIGRFEWPMVQTISVFTIPLR
jgi:hypothetical protein